MHLAGKSIKNHRSSVVSQWLSFMPSSEKLPSTPMGSFFHPIPCLTVSWTAPCSNCSQFTSSSSLISCPSSSISRIQEMKKGVQRMPALNRKQRNTFTEKWIPSSCSPFQSSHWKPFEANPNYQRNLKHSHFFAATHQSAFHHGRLRLKMSNSTKKQTCKVGPLPVTSRVITPVTHL